VTSMNDKEAVRTASVPPAPPTVNSGQQAPTVKETGIQTAGFPEYALLLCLAALLGSNFMATKIAVTALPPMSVVVMRLAIAAGVLTVIMLAVGQRFPKGRIWFAIFAAGIFGHTLPFALIAWGQQKVDAGVASILMASMPLFTLFLAQVFTHDERPNRYSVVGFSIAMVGIIVLFGPERLASLADQSLRQYAIMMAAMCYGINAIITKSLLEQPWQKMSAAFMCVAFLQSLPLLWFVDWSAMSATASVWSAIIYTGLGPTALGAVMIVLLVRRAGAAFLSQINFLVPVFGALFAVFLLGEVLPPNAFIALGIILAGVALARRRPKRKIFSINKGA